MAATGRRSRRKSDWGDLLGPRLRWIIVAGILVISMVPLLDMMLISITPEDIAAGGGLAPRLSALSNYAEIWVQAQLLRGMVNSVIIAGGAAFVAVVVAFGAAYTISRTEFMGRHLILYGLLAAQSIPGAIILFPLYIVLISLQALLNVVVVGSYPAIVLTYTSFALPFAMWLLASYIATIPREVEEAAMADGATRGQVLRHIIVPLAGPGAVVAFIFAFLLGWNDVLFASVMTDNTTRTLAIALQIFNLGQESGGAIPEYAHLMAASIVSALPVVILYLLFQRRLTGVLTLGAIK